MRPLRGTPGLEMWAGIECTLNRVGATQHDQLELSGHYAREGDLELIASLGVRTLRYPILWERIERNVPDGRAWEWTDAQMARLRTLGIDPIVGLVHHGSGPLDTDLLDPRFGERLAAFARTVAERYPWVTRFTPVNEPLTTARFSALYGRWYPHARGDRHFLRALLNQVRATRLAMNAIRQVAPGAQLVQTEDLGHTHATPRVEEQAAFENARRWLTFDLLTSRVTDAHPLWDYFRWAGVGAGEIEEAMGDGCAPDVLGINHYVTSERWLDHRIERYPTHTHGGNHRSRYADVEAVRASPDSVLGPATLLIAAWERYGIPLAVTEAHLGCTREQQLRWLHQVWLAASEARSRGAQVQAVTAWAAFGTHDWSSLVTELRGDYEPGLFDTRSPRPRRTALGNMVRALATTGRCDHPALDGAGWWHPSGLDRAPRSTRAHPLVVIGAHGTLGSAVLRAAAARGLDCRGLGRADLDIVNAADVARVLGEIQPWAVVNAAGYVRVDEAEGDVAACRRANVRGAENLARWCATHGVRCAAISSDLVFDGRKGVPYVEGDGVAPLGVYGASKADAETRVLGAAPNALVARTSWFFGPWDDWNFITTALRQVATGASVELPGDLVISPTYVPHLADALLDLLIDGERGIWHLANDGSGTAADIVRRVASDAGLDPSLVSACASTDLGFVAARPPSAALTSERGRLMPSLDHALRQYIASRAWERDTRSDAPVGATNLPCAIQA